MQAKFLSLSFNAGSAAIMAERWPMNAVEPEAVSGVVTIRFTGSVQRSGAASPNDDMRKLEHAALEVVETCLESYANLLRERDELKARLASIIVEQSP